MKSSALWIGAVVLGIAINNEAGVFTCVGFLFLFILIMGVAFWVKQNETDSARFARHFRRGQK